MSTDDDIVEFCFENDFIIVTGNARDFRWLCGNVELHPGLIVIPPLPKEEQLELFPRVITYQVAGRGDTITEAIERESGRSILIARLSHP